MKDLLPLLIIGGAAYLIWQEFQKSASAGVPTSQLSPQQQVWQLIGQGGGYIQQLPLDCAHDPRQCI